MGLYFSKKHDSKTQSVTAFCAMCYKTDKRFVPYGSDNHIVRLKEYRREGWILYLNTKNTAQCYCPNCSKKILSYKYLLVLSGKKRALNKSFVELCLAWMKTLNKLNT